MRRTARSLVVPVVLLTACGSDDASVTDQTDGSPEASSDTTAPSSTDSPTETGAGSSRATVTVGDESYEFAVVDDEGSCAVAGGFSATFYLVDGQGQPVAGEDEAIAGILPEARMSLSSEELGGAPGSVIVLSAGEGWVAEAGGVESLTIDGNHAEGTATFTSMESGELVSGTFEATCEE